MYRRHKRRSPFAAYAALLFNALLCLSPFVAARTVVAAYGDRTVELEVSEESMEATRSALDARFLRLARREGGQDRATWANLVRTEIEAGEMSAVRGLLLAAPQMLSGEDAASLSARIAVADGGGSDVAIAAALSYLPDDVQAEYERKSAPLIAQFDEAQVTSGDGEGETPEVADDQFVFSPDSYDSETSQFSVLGDLRDLSLQAARWTRSGRIDEFAFSLSGVGLILADDAARDGASIALSAYRAQSLNEDFVAYLQDKLFNAAPPQRLKLQLTSKMQHEFGYVTDGPVILEEVFRTSADPAALESLLVDLRLIHGISLETSPMSAVTILSLVENSSDLRRARLVSQAGGDKAVALALNEPQRLLDSARTVLEWTPQLIALTAASALCLLLLAGVAFNVIVRSIKRGSPQRRSAVYQLEEMVST